MIHAERPDLLPGPERAEHDRALAMRLTVEEPSHPVSLPKALAEMDALLAEAEAEQMAFLQEHRSHLAQCLDKASRALHLDIALAVPAPEFATSPVP